MKFCPVDRTVNADDALRCRNCGHVFKKGRKDAPAPTASLPPSSKAAPARTASREDVAVRRIGSPPSGAPRLQVLDAEGRVVETFRLGAEPTVLGRSEGWVTFPGDARLSPAHASVRCDGVQAFLRDLKSRHGTFLRAERVEIFDGLECLVGETLLRWVPAGAGWKVISPRGEAVFEGAFTIGRRGQDLALDDAAVSGPHAKVKRSGEGATLVDAKSLNGLYYRIPAQRNEVLEPGGMFRIGSQLFRFELPGP